MRTEETNAAAGVGARNGAESTARQRTGTENRAGAGAAQSLDRYVKTKDAQAAIEGHEVEIVQALGIPWRAGQRDHIRCPYPDHGGADDWRLNPKGRAICTCTGGKTDSVFDIASKVEGLDFEAAKIRCIEIVGRADLIRTKAEGSNNYQTTDARSLLSAPADRRDDTLARAYLAHRLGIEHAAVIMPSTPAVGLKELAYFDPPKTAKGKPVKVGDWPCVVFGQIDAQGRQHAHRIYVEPGGAGKARLGIGPKGGPRDPKKSAKITEGDTTTAGRVVTWGNPKVAPWAISAEGIETAAAVANAFRAEIETEAAYIVAGINAGGVEAFAPWPNTKRVTVAADRDEAAKISSNPTRRGERAARAFGIRNHERIAVSYALAGEPGTGTDWLDVHEAGGPEAVRSGILDDVAYHPSEAEVAAERERIDGTAELQRIERDYPLPPMESVTLAYQRTKTGKVWVHQAMKVGEAVEMVPVASAFGVAARLRMADEGDAYGLRLVVQDMNGRCRQIDVDRAAFARQGAADTRAMLFGAGLRTENDGEHIAVKCVKAADPAREIIVVRRPGWHTSDSGVPFFVCPSGQIFGAEGDDKPELSVNTKISPAVASGGTMEGWRQAVTAACTAPHCEHWTLGTIAGFAAPVLSLCGLDSCGINLSGMTSGGKTTAQRLAVSAWSRAALDQRESLLQSARATANGIELMAARSNGTVLALDELGHVHGKELGRIIYSLASGVGKTRMGAEAQLRTSYTWSVFVIFSAEKSLEEKVRGDGGEWAGGMAVRIPDVDISGINRAVDQAVLDQIGAIDRNFGHAGPAFVEALIAAGLHLKASEIRQGITQAAQAIAGAGADGKHVRAALPFAILSTAGKLAQRLGVLPEAVDVGRAVRWAWERFTKSTDAVALDPEQQATTNLRAWIAERWGSSIHPTMPDDGARPPNRDALGWYDETAVYLPAQRIVEAAGGALKEIEIGRALDAQGFIAKTKDADCYFVSFVPKIGKIKAYALSRSAFGRTTRDEPAFAVHSGGRA
ncbi:hypothetical protein ASG52_24550 [Methylobacterium sp. Leaf456]|uniref:DUF927 domain-containing protein n=1 Tax=Methylobacterium sp. Leaf456 TaxID=1736382 RepID=UPI0006FA7414|nr:DUF927 domain-containing protein [Methylobacterium sp. Leaf456]KQT56093.1 hypothetical protein ASG52_24550 [Methylobacterium sp. Leaf456]